MLKNWICAAIIATVGVFGGSAQAADVAPDASYDWTGFYLGANVGYGWGSADYSYDASLLGAPGAAPVALRAFARSTSPVGIDYDGIVGGGQIGYNWQINGVVLGLEVDASASGVDGDQHTQNNPPCFVEGCSAQVDWFGTGRARIGYAIDSFMPFVTGGVALAGLQGSADNEACGSGCDYNDTSWGWTVGGGVEWGFADRWSAKAEYLYTNFGAPDFSGPLGKNVSSDDVTLNVVRVGINYRIN